MNEQYAARVLGPCDAGAQASVRTAAAEAAPDDDVGARDDEVERRLEEMENLNAEAAKVLR